MVSVINKQLLLTAYAYLFIMGQQGAQQGSEALRVESFLVEFGKFHDQTADAEQTVFERLTEEKVFEQKVFERQDFIESLKYACFFDEKGPSEEQLGNQDQLRQWFTNSCPIARAEVLELIARVEVAAIFSNKSEADAEDALKKWWESNVDLGKSQSRLWEDFCKEVVSRKFAAIFSNTPNADPQKVLKPFNESLSKDSPLRLLDSVDFEKALGVGKVAAIFSNTSEGAEREQKLTELRAGIKPKATFGHVVRGAVDGAIQAQGRLQNYKTLLELLPRQRTKDYWTKKWAANSGNWSKEEKVLQEMEEQEGWRRLPVAAGDPQKEEEVLPGQANHVTGVTAEKDHAAEHETDYKARDLRHAMLINEAKQTASNVCHEVLQSMGEEFDASPKIEKKKNNILTPNKKVKIVPANENNCFKFFSLPSCFRKK